MGAQGHQDIEARITNNKFRLLHVLMPHNNEKCKLSYRDFREANSQ
jgi:hypothetical protein